LPPPDLVKLDIAQLFIASLPFSPPNFLFFPPWRCSKVFDTFDSPDCESFGSRAPLPPSPPPAPSNFFTDVALALPYNPDNLRFSVYVLLFFKGSRLSIRWATVDTTAAPSTPLKILFAKTCEHDNVNQFTLCPSRSTFIQR